MTTKDKPLILITNDDGIQAKGIKELTNSLKDLGEIVVFAPDGPRSGASCAITSIEPVHCKQIKKKRILPYIYVQGRLPIVSNWQSTKFLIRSRIWS